MYTEVSHLSAYISFHKFDIICFSETYPNSETPSVDDSLKIHGYCFIREDHSSNSKCACCKNLLPFKVVSVKYLQENISSELRVRDKCC